ncbi:hypothetical protein TNCT_323601 [Trichonephila clavata]|uniref:Uncharacterized protein n=1 Tax=Trichonephila clavata TaxID=2740835 RepID=A0A8X6FZE2_TRICU|nr:hypothetical protein TNCT_323601 [Trichonephila clavata]
MSLYDFVKEVDVLVERDWYVCRENRADNCLGEREVYWFKIAERIAIVSWKLGGKINEVVSCQSENSSILGRMPGYSRKDSGSFLTVLSDVDDHPGCFSFATLPARMNLFTSSQILVDILRIFAGTADTPLHMFYQPVSRKRQPFLILRKHLF